MKLKPCSILAAVVAFSLALPGAAMADRRGHDGHYRDYSGGHGYKHHKHHKRYKRHHGDRHHYRGHRGGYTNKYYYDDDDDEDILIGLVVGGILGYALGGAQHSNANDYGSAPPPSPGYPPAVNYSYAPDSGSCLQEREYQTTVIVGGREVDAYGTACLQPDGSWLRGPAQVANY